MNKTFIHKAVISLCFIYASPVTFASENIVSGIINGVAHTTGQIITSIIPEDNTKKSHQQHVRHHSSQSTQMVKSHKTHHGQNMNYTQQTKVKNQNIQVKQTTQPDNQESIIVKQNMNKAQPAELTTIQKPEQAITSSQKTTTLTNESIPANTTTNFEVKEPNLNSNSTLVQPSDKK